MGLNFKFIVIWKALSTMPPKVAISAADVKPGSFGSAGSKTASSAAPSAPKQACRKAAGGGQVNQLSSEVKNLREELAALKAASASTDARLGKVEKNASETQSGIEAILGMMQEDRKQRELPAPPPRPAIMPPSAASQRSPSPQPKMTLVTSGPEGSFGKECGWWVPEWQSSESTSARVSSGQNGWADKAVAGGGAMVVSKPTGTLPSPSSLSRKGPLPSPSSLPESGRNSTGMSGSGLVRCNDDRAFFQSLKTKKWDTMLALVQGSNPSNHVLTAAVNAAELSPNNESIALAIACFDRARSVSAFDSSQQDCMRAAFNPENPAFNQFCMRMAEYCSRSPDKGIKFRGQVYPYAHLAQNDQHRKELIAALRDN